MYPQIPLLFPSSPRQENSSELVKSELVGGGKGETEKGYPHVLTFLFLFLPFPDLSTGGNIFLFSTVGDRTLALLTQPWVTLLPDNPNPAPFFPLHLHCPMTRVPGPAPETAYPE